MGTSLDKQIIEERASVARSLLEFIGLAAAGATILVAPNLAQLLPKLSRKTSLNERQLRKAISYARQYGWVELREDSQGIQIAITKKGKLRWQRLQLDQPLPRGRWDKKWRIVIFDISSTLPTERNAFRESLKKLGFKQLQRSVWITPFPCLKEISALRTLYALTIHQIKLIEAPEFEGDSDFRQLFKV